MFGSKEARKERAAEHQRAVAASHEAERVRREAEQQQLENEQLEEAKALLSLGPEALALKAALCIVQGEKESHIGLSSNRFAMSSALSNLAVAASLIPDVRDSVSL